MSSRMELLIQGGIVSGHAALATALYAGDESKANRSGSASLPDTLPHRPQWGRDGNGAIPAGISRTFCPRLLKNFLFPVPATANGDKISPSPSPTGIADPTGPVPK